MSDLIERPLFIPLKREHYEAFERGVKSIEWRAYGPRWNEKTCRPGRAVVLSLGYGKQRRLYGKVADYNTYERQAEPVPKTALDLLPKAAKFAAITMTALKSRERTE